MSALTPPLHVVKLRWARGVWTSPQMTPHEAEQLADSLRVQVDNIGEGPGFVIFTNRDGIRLQLRGRDVVAVEDGPAPEYRPRAHGFASGGLVEAPEGGGHPPLNGTEFLRQHAQVHAHQVVPR